MTTPTVGYPDHQALPQWRGNPLFQGQYTITTAAPLVVSNWVTNWESLAIDLYCSTNIGCTLTVTFYTDSTQTTQCGTYTWVMTNSGVSLQVLVPCLGDWMVATLSSQQPSAQMGTLTLEPTNIAVTKPSYQQSGNYIAGKLVSINPAATLIVTLPFVVEGIGYFRVECNTAGKSYDMTVDMLTEGNLTAATIDRLTSVTGANKFVTLQIPALTATIQIRNDDVAAQTYTYFFGVNPQ